MSKSQARSTLNLIVTIEVLIENESKIFVKIGSLESYNKEFWEDAILKHFSKKYPDKNISLTTRLIESVTQEEFNNRQQELFKPDET